MEPTQSLERPPVGRHGDPCASCGGPLAQDQRYCLACGARRPGLPAMLSGPPTPPEPAPAPPPLPVAPAPARLRPDTALAAGVGCLLLALLVGVLIGRAGRDEAPAAAAPQVLTVGAAPAATPTAAAPAAFTSDWPDGKKGFTVQLQALPKDGTDAGAVAAAKQAAVSAGAADVGALDSDDFGSLDPGQYVVYSGQFADTKGAKGALAGLKAKFPGAKVVEVSADGGGTAKAPTSKEQKQGAKAIQDLQDASPEEYQKKSAKLPKQVTTPGKLPPKDNKPAGGGGDSESFE
jgi:hypothetical protein